MVYDLGSTGGGLLGAASSTGAPGLQLRQNVARGNRDTVRRDIIEHENPTTPYNIEKYRASQRFPVVPPHRPVLPGGKLVPAAPRPTDRPQGKMWLPEPKHGDGAVRGQRHFPARQIHLQPDLKFDKKIKVRDPHSGVLKARLRSDQYEFNQLYGSVRAEVWSEEQSRTFSHKEQLFPTAKLVRAEEKVYMANKRCQPGKGESAPRLVECPPEMHQRGVLKNSSVERFYNARKGTAFCQGYRASRGLQSRASDAPRTALSSRGGRLSTAGSNLSTSSSVKDAEIARLSREIASARNQAASRRQEAQMPMW
jgi:hypothetical protein